MLQAPQPGKEPFPIFRVHVDIRASDFLVLQLHGRWQDGWVDYEIKIRIPGERNRKVLKGCELTEAWCAAGADAAVELTDRQVSQLLQRLQRSWGRRCGAHAGANC